MKVKVTTEEILTYHRTYYVDGVNSLENAAKCAERCYNHLHQPNTYCCQRIETPTKDFKVTGYEVVEE